jgi:hypothetical protein
MDPMAPSDPVAAALRRLAAEDKAQSTSAAVRSRLLAEVRRMRLARRRSRATIAVIAAGLSVATALPIWQLARLERISPSSDGHALSASSAEGELVTAFFPLQYSSIPMSAGRLVRLAVPREAMASFGIEEVETAPGQLSSLVLAEVMVGDDGLARAVRFVRPLRSDMRKELQR